MSKFRGVLKARQPEAADTPKVRTAERPAGQPSEKVRVGRPPAKRSDPDYQQVTAYIRRDTYTAARQRLFGEGMEFSELVEKLVSEWLRA